MDDKVRLEILSNRFQAIVDEMAQVISRTAHTVFVKETQDYGAVLVTRQGWRVGRVETTRATGRASNADRPVNNSYDFRRVEFFVLGLNWVSKPLRSRTPFRMRESRP